MPTATISNRFTVDGTAYTTSTTVAADGVVRKELTGGTALAVAKTGQLTTRTDDDTGELTMTAGHGITTGQRLDVYWDGGMRRGMTVGTVATNQVPIDGGAGDVLPTNLTSVTAQVPSEESFAVTGNDVQFIFAKSSRKGCIVFVDGTDTELHAIVLEGTNGNGYQWYTGNGVTNPLAGDTVTDVFFSNGDSGNTNNIVAGVGND